MIQPKLLMSPLLWKGVLLSIAQLFFAAFAELDRQNPTDEPKAASVSEQSPIEEVEYDLYQMVPGKTPKHTLESDLIKSIIADNILATKELVTAGADPHQVGQGEWTTLMVAAAWGRERHVAYFLELGVPINATTHAGWTALMLAIYRDHQQVALNLMNQGANVGADARVAFSFLAGQLYTGRFPHLRKTLKILLEKNLEKGEGNFLISALTLAILQGNHDLIEAMLDRGLNPNQTTSEGTPPLIWATLTGSPNLTRFLLEHGADPNKSTPMGKTPLMFATAFGFHQVVETLIEFKADLNAVDFAGNTVVHFASAWEGSGLLSLLKAHGAKIDERNNTGETPLLIALEANNPDAVLMLLKIGANPNKAAEDEWTPLLEAATKGQDHLIAPLVKAGAEIEARDPYLKKTPLMWAAGYGHERVVKILVRSGASVVARDRDGFTAADIAAYQGHHELSRYLWRQLGEKER
ncbi:Ankyrin repeat domain-containing protein [Sulfidibacter corallicola]|uniref:Ankyrin repeat domain-containing protein n=1 Tax=Sulfidibacter corallicola TaxID=2818388 RepID=A0A8A4TW47_SULCO|nr:ankyrin repeat domain-containing protein [Sulfidibacter corallicola]QTD53192.1 ankyrin repeat domain-containing protein [Sulfidibacter corallicola]